MKLPIFSLVAAATLVSTGCSLLNVTAGATGVPGKGIGISSAAPIGFIYTTLYGKNAVMEINNTQSRANPDPIVTPNGPRSIVVDPRGIQQYMYVVCELADTLAIVDRRSRNVVRSINVGRRPYGIAVTPDGSRAFVTNSDDDTVSVIDTTSNNVISTIQLNAFATNQPGATPVAGTSPTATTRLTPKGIASNSTGTKIYVACAAGYLIELDGQPPTVNAATAQVTSPGNLYSATKNVPLTGSVQPLNVAVSSDTNSDNVYVTDPPGNKVFYVAPTSSTAQVVQGSGAPWGVAVGRNASTGKADRLYVTQSSGNAVAQYNLPDLGGGTGASVEGHNPQAIAVSPDGNDVYVSVTGDNAVADMTRTTGGSLSRPAYFNLTSLNQQYVTSTGDIALGGYLF